MDYAYNMCLCCSVSEVDQLLVHLQSFSSSSNHFTIPECLAQGIALFSLNSAYSKRKRKTPCAGKRTSGATVRLNVKDVCAEQFAVFWKPVSVLDPHI